MQCIQYIFICNVYSKAIFDSRLMVEFSVSTVQYIFVCCAYRTFCMQFISQICVRSTYCIILCVVHIVYVIYVVHIVYIYMQCLQHIFICSAYSKHIFESIVSRWRDVEHRKSIVARKTRVVYINSEARQLVGQVYHWSPQILRSFKF